MEALRSQCHKYISVVLLLICIVAGGCSDDDVIKPEAIQKSIDRAGRYLANQVQDDGRFVYRVNMNSAVQIKDRYNILRHAGCIYALCMYQQQQPSPKTIAICKRAGSYLKRSSIGPIAGSNHILAIWSKPEINHSHKPFQAKLGGTGLGLVALLSIEKIEPGFTPLPVLQALGHFLVIMQKPDGSFYSKYIPSRGGRRDEWQSLYYPGEAALGLLMLFEKDPSSLWLKTAAKALGYLAKSRIHTHDVPADHWSLLATQKILRLPRNLNLPVSRQLLHNHALKICRSTLRSQIFDHDQAALTGGFTRDGRTTPTSTRLEGLLAALTFIPPSSEIHQKFKTATQKGISFLLRAQINTGEYIGAFPRAITKKSLKLKGSEKFNRRASEVRIDYVQHALSALIQYRQDLTTEKKS